MSGEQAQAGRKKETDGDAAGHKQANDNGRHKEIVRQIVKGIVEHFTFVH